MRGKGTRIDKLCADWMWRAKGKKEQSKMTQVLSLVEKWEHHYEKENS